MAGFKNSSKNRELGNIKIDYALLKRHEKAIAKEFAKSEGMRREISAVLGNVVTGELFVEDTNNSRIYISDGGNEPSALGTIPNLDINPKYLKFGQPVKIRKTNSGGYVYIRLDTETAESFNEGNTDTIDQTPVSQSQLDWASLKPYQGLVATVKGAIYGDIAVPDLSTADFSASPLDTASNPIDIPTTANRAIGILVQLDPATATLSYKQSAEFNIAIGLAEAYRNNLLPVRDASKKRKGYLKLVNGAAQFDNSTVWTCPEWFPDFQPLDVDLTALAGLSTTGLITRTGAGTAAARAITGTSPISVTNGDGVAANPAVSLDIDGQSAYGSPPDESLVFAAQSIGTSDFWKLTGDEMRRWLASAPATSFSTDSRAMQAYAFNDTTDRTITINSSSVAAGQQMRIHTVQVSGGTGHKVLLPAGVYFGETGTNRAALFDTVGDYLDALCFDIGGTFRFLYMQNGVTFAAS